jgi:hypothetical protein
VARVQLEFVGNASDPLWVLLKNYIRVKGGGGPNGVQVALGQTR